MSNENKDEKLNPKEIYELRKKEKNQIKKKSGLENKINMAPQKVSKYLIYTIVTVAILFSLGWLISLVPNLPPNSQENHSENSPSAHILTTKIPNAIQRHMLEHADGNGLPGIIIQYNCDDYNCESDLIQKLTTMVKEYPRNVYLAPNNYDGKIILTKNGKREILENFNEEKIRNFINTNR